MFGLITYIGIVFTLASLTLKKPAAAVGGVLCLFALEQWGTSTQLFFFENTQFTNFIIGFILLLGLLVKFLSSTSTEIQTHRSINTLVVLLYMYSMTSITWAPNYNLSYEQWVSVWPYIVLSVLLTPLLISSTDDIMAASRSLVLLGSCLIFLLLFFSDWGTRGIAIIGHKNIYGDPLTANPLAIANLAGFVAITMAFGNVWQRVKFWPLIKIVILLVCVALMIKSGSRGQTIFLFCSLIIFWPFAYKVNSIKGFSLTVFVTALMIVLTNWAIDDFWSGQVRWSQEQLSADFGSRFTQSLELLHHWWNGGLGNLIFGLGNSASFDPKIIGGYPHIVPLEVLGEEGLLGFGLYLAMLVLSARCIIRILRETKDQPDSRGFFVAICAMYVFSFILTLKEGSLLGSTEFFMFTILIGNCEMILFTEKERRSREENFLASVPQVLHPSNFRTFI